MMREVCFLIGEDGAILWSDASDSPVALPDSRARWEAIWSRRENLAEIAHSHPAGPEAFSTEDETTMAAIVPALGREIRFSVVTPKAMVVREYRLREEGAWEAGPDVRVPASDEPWWAALMRLASGV